MGLIVIIRILWVLDTVRDKFFEGALLADEFDELGYAASAAEHNQLFLFEEQLLDRAALLLAQQLVDLHVASIGHSKNGG